MRISNSILLFILIKALFLLFYNSLNIVTSIISLILALIFYFIINKMKLYNNKYLMIIIAFILFFLSLYLLNEISLIIKDTFLKNTNILLISLSFIFISLYLAYRDFHTFIKTVELTSYLIILYNILSLILLIPYININNLINIDLTINNNFYLFSFFLLIILILIKYLTKLDLNYKVYFSISTYIILFKLLITSILSRTLESVFKYPYISIFKKISFLNFLERLEVFLSMEYLYEYFILLTFFIISFKYIIKKRN